MTPKRIGLIGFDGVVAIDLAGPAEVFDAPRSKRRQLFKAVLRNNHDCAFKSAVRIGVGTSI